MYGSSGTSWGILPWWVWLSIFVALVVAEVVNGRIKKSRGDESGSVWDRPTSRKGLGRYLAFRVGLLAVVVIIVVIVEAIRH